MAALFDLVRSVAPTSSTVLITGESGTGKELVAKAIHALSPRKDAPFVSINCGALPETLLESELFGHMKGAFTDAHQNKKGLFEAAHRGTLFLDEVGETPPAMQVKLLRALQEKKIRRVGGTDEVEVDVRVIAATNVPLETLVREKRFREDLFYRLKVIPIRTPPLRERREDIPLLAEHFLQQFAERDGQERRQDLRGGHGAPRAALLARQRARARERHRAGGGPRDDRRGPARAPARDACVTARRETRRPADLGPGFSLDEHLPGDRARAACSQALAAGRGGPGRGRRAPRGHARGRCAT